MSPENPTGAKGHAFETIPVGRSHTLADMQGAGTIDRMWLTLEDRSPDALRGLPAIAPAAERTADLRPPAEKK